MPRVTGVGGIFFKSPDPEKLYSWYEKYLGIKRAPHGAVEFSWRDGQDSDGEGRTVWSIFPKDTEYLGPKPSPFMINYLVDDLDALLNALKDDGVEIDPHREDCDFGKFAWIKDLDGNRVELWEPPKKG